MDLADEAWQAVEIRADGWQVLAELRSNFGGHAACSHSQFHNKREVSMRSVPL